MREASVLMGAAVLVLTGAASAGASIQQRTSAPASLVFDRVTVVDVEQGKLVPDQRVVIVRNRFQAVGVTSAVRIPKGAQTVDARDKYLIPGLWDMHVHVQQYPDVMYPLFIAHGVTGVRDAHQPLGLDSLHKWRREIAASTRVGPRIVGTGPWLTTPQEVRDHDSSWNAVAVATPEDGRRIADSLKAAGADFIKVRSNDFLPRAIYFAIAAETRRAGIPLIGHVPDSVAPAEASDSGQRSLEHLASSIVRLCAGEGDSGEKRCAALAARLVRNGTWVTPTLVEADNVFIRRPERARYWPDPVRAASPFQFLAPWSAAARDSVFAPFQLTLRRMQRLGVPLLTGTDVRAGAPEITPGLSLHDEMALFVEAGLAPLEALQAATLSPAKYLRATDSLGTVAAGKLADLVLLDADPLADIRNTTRIRAVVANGRYYDRAALDTLLAQVERGARSSP